MGDAYFYLGFIYERGKGVDKDLRIAKIYYYNAIKYKCIADKICELAKLKLKALE
ncbi:MAG: SEL1-like repeat protein [Deltaproteobacteria bacterium]|nr:SEL1-like repeat protein [Deltaproteobacteria bacterium]